MLQKMNLPALAANLIALIVYLVSPIISIAVLFGMNGMQSMRFFGFLFVVPLILMVIVMLLSFYPNNMVSSVASFITVLYLIIMMIFIPDAVLGKVSDVAKMVAIGFPFIDEVMKLVNMGSSLVISASWGLYLTMALCILGSVGGLALSFMAAPQKTARPAASTTRPTKINNLYRS